MFKSKHSGWTWDLKRTPFGGGGGFISSITDPISEAIGTSGSGGGVLGALADIDPGPAIGQGLSEVDTFVNREVPGGWTLPAAIALAYATGYIDPTLFASEAAAAAGAEAGAGAIATEAGQAAFFDALAAGATSTEAVSAGLAADAALTGAASYGGASSLGNLSPAVSGEIGASTGTGTFGSLNPALPSAGSVGGAGAGLSAELAPGTILGTGLEGGGAIGSSYAAGANGLPATDFFGNYIPASSVNFGGVPNTVAGTGYNLDTLKQLNQARQGVSTASNLAKMLQQGSMSGLSSSLGSLAQGANPMAMEQLQAARGNQNPFVFAPQQPIQDTKSAQLASLLRQG